jgi:hypothetical protein
MTKRRIRKEATGSTAALQEETVGLLRWVVAARENRAGWLVDTSAEHSGVNGTIFVGS